MELKGWLVAGQAAGVGLVKVSSLIVGTDCIEAVVESVGAGGSSPPPQAQRLSTAVKAAAAALPL
jgi:hypothetical protein